MNNYFHSSAESSHYDKEADHYDIFNEKKSEIINKYIEKIFNENGAKTVLDLTCGTGSQVFWLAEHGYEVVGVDINSKMLKIAKEKSENKKLNIPFYKGDMRTTMVGEYDGVITIFNSVGHLTKEDFEKSMRNIHDNLNDQGLYIFDIFNLTYLQKDNNITKLTIDWLKKMGDKTVREIQYSTIDKEGILASFDIYHEQKGTAEPNISTAYQTLQVYSAQQLREMLQRNGFKVLIQCDVDGSKFSEYKSECILTVAQKI